MSNPTDGWDENARVTLACPPTAQLASVQWEYRVRYWPLIPSDPDDPGKEARAFEDGLNAMGADGWELVSTIGGTTGVRCFFKRPAGPPIFYYELGNPASHEAAIKAAKAFGGRVVVAPHGSRPDAP